jgi:hypothetical protein
LDGAAKTSGRTQAQEAERLIELGRVFEQFGRFTLPPELQETAVQLLSAHAGGLGTVITYLIEQGESANERWAAWQGLYSALWTYRANHPELFPDRGAENAAKEQQPGPADEAAA